MGIGNDVIIEGRLYVIHSNKIGLPYSKKRYFVLQHDHLLHTFKSLQQYSMNKDPIRSIAINSRTRVTDNGRKSVQRRVFFIFRLYNSSKHDDHVKLGASSREEAARWIQSFQEAALKADLNPQDLVGCPKREWQYVRSNYSRRVHGTPSLSWACSSASSTDPMTADVVAPSAWTIFGCHNGLRLFKETKERECPGKSWDDYPAIMGMCVVNGTSEAIFQIVMSLGFSRSEWDYCFYKGTVVEHVDDHTDIIHKLLYGDWQPWGMKRRDLLLHRYWRRDEDGTYVILYHSVLHKKCPPHKGYVRASLKSGGYVISPVNQGEQSVVRHMLSIDWKYWKPYRQASSAQSITIRMLGRLAALREWFSSKSGGCSSSDSTLRESMTDSRFHPSEKAENAEAQKKEENEETVYDAIGTPAFHSCHLGLDDDADEFFHASEYDQLEICCPSPFGLEMYSQDASHAKLSTAAYFVKKLHEHPVQTIGYIVGTDDMLRQNGVSCSYGTTLPQDPTSNLLSSWSDAGTSMFQIRGKTYLEDQKKIAAKGTLMQMVGVDWLRSDKREDDLAGRPGSIVQRYAANGRPEFFFIVNFQVPGSTAYNLAFYHMMSAPMEDAPLLASFIHGDDAYRNSRFKLIPSVSKGPWIIKQSIRKKGCLIAQILPINHVRGPNYLELDVDVGGSAIARGLATMAFSYFSNLVVDLAFLIEGKTEEELPECLLGAFQLNHLDLSKSVLVKP